jgi:hypothetical protein
MIRERYRKSLVQVSLTPDQIAQAKSIAAHNSIDYKTQLRLWIAERIQREAISR